jgi:hypothetical protein
MLAVLGSGAHASLYVRVHNFTSVLLHVTIWQSLTRDAVLLHV